MLFLDLTRADSGVATAQVMIELQKANIRSIGVTPLQAASVQSQLVGAIAFEYGFALFIRKLTFWYVQIETPISSYGRQDLESRCRGRISLIPAKWSRHSGEIIAFHVHEEDDLWLLVNFLCDCFGNERRERPLFSELSRCGGLPQGQFEPYTS